MQRLSNTGEKLGSIDIEQINNLMGYPSLSIHRYDFQQLNETPMARSKDINTF